MAVILTTLDEIISDTDTRLRAGIPSLAGVHATFLFRLSGRDGGDFCVVIYDGHGKAMKGSAADPDLTFSMPADAFVAITQGEQDGVILFMTGQITMRGDQALALALAPLWLERADWAAQLNDTLLLGTRHATAAFHR
jgi:putative sterol carrier protein